MPNPGTSFFGYRGKWARIDLTNRKVKIEDDDSAVYANYIGG